MSLLQDAQRCLANQFSKRHLRAFISVLNNDAVQKAVGAAEVQSAGDRKGTVNALDVMIDLLTAAQGLSMAGS